MRVILRIISQLYRTLGGGTNSLLSGISRAVRAALTPARARPRPVGALPATDAATDADVLIVGGKFHLHERQVRRRGTLHWCRCKGRS